MTTEGLVRLRENEGKNNSPWNIVAAFTVDMSFSAEEIETMLVQYENDYDTGMDTKALLNEIYDYTNGYPFLVSRICQCIDLDLEVKDWSTEGIQKAIKELLIEKNTLFDDIIV